MIYNNIMDLTDPKIDDNILKYIINSYVKYDDVILIIRILIITYINTIKYIQVEQMDVNMDIYNKDDMFYSSTTEFKNVCSFATDLNKSWFYYSLNESSSMTDLYESSSATDGIEAQFQLTYVGAQI